MATFRVFKESGNFVTVHKSFIHDDNLTWKAKGILLYLLSRPDDWQVYETELNKHSSDGRDSLRTGIKELEQAGYIHRTRKRNEKGQLKEYEYQVFEQPTQIGKSHLGKSNLGKSNTTNNNNTNNNNTNNETGDTSQIFQLVSNELEMIQSPLKVQELEELIKDLGNEALDIVKVATDYTRDNNKGINYLIKVLTNWIKEDVDTKEKAENKVKPKTKKQSSNIDGMLDDLLGSDS